MFDAWGNIVKVQDGAGNTLAGLTVLDRGYTGHEHLQSVGIIHMNGRLYDPRLHRFLQPDNFIQQPENTQNYNKYGYVLNNPLKYTDPSGEEFITLGVAVIIGAVIAATTYTMTAALTDVPFTLGGLAKATFIGAASAAVTFGIGSAASSMFTTQAMNFWQGAFQGGVIGSITGAGGTVVNAVFTGQNITLKAVLGGAAIGGAIGSLSGGIQGAKNGEKFYNACDKMGINPDGAVPATDAFLKQAQENWFPDAPMDKIKTFTVENPTANVKDFFTKFPNTYAVTNPLSINKEKLTGNSSVYFNRNTAFSSAKTLYMTMGHEFVHVSQYAALAGQPLSLVQNPAFRNGLMEYHAYSYQHNVLGDDFKATMFTPDVVRGYITQFGDYFNSMNYINFSWTTNTSFIYPFIKK